MIKFLSALLFIASISLAEEPANTQAVPTYTPPETKYLTTAQVTVDVLMVSVPEDEALKLIPILRDPKTIETGRKSLLDLVASKRAILLDWPELTTHDRVQGVSESILEKRYQVPPETPGEAAARKLVVDGGLVEPTGVEVKNVGVSLQVDPAISPDGKSVTLSIMPQRVEYLGLEKTENPKTASQPIFATKKVTSTITLRDGEHRLIFTGKSESPGSGIDFFILGVRIIPAEK
jgi:hypothetical protein